MNAYTWFDSSKVVRISPAVTLGPAALASSFEAGQIRRQRLHIVREQPVQNLHQLSIRTQNAISSAEGIAFAVLGGASLAGVVASFYL